MTQTKVRIVAMGDSTTAGTPAFKSPREAPPTGSGDETSQYAYWLMQAHPGLGGRQPGHQRAAQRSDRGAVRGRRDRAEARGRRDHRRRQRRLPGPAGAARQGSACRDVQARPRRRHPRRRRHDHPLQHRDGGSERADEGDQRLDPFAGARGSRRDFRRHARRGRRAGQSRQARQLTRTACIPMRRATARWPTRSRPRSCRR